MACRVDLESAVRAVIVAAVGGIGAAAGFSHTHDWAIHNGQAGWLAWADAVVIESMALVAGLELRRDHGVRRDHAAAGVRRRVTLPAVVLVTAFAVQMVAQVALAPRTPAGWVLAATPALGFLVVVKLLLRRLPESSEATEDAPQVESVPVVAVAERTELAGAVQVERDAPAALPVAEPVQEQVQAAATPVAAWPPR